MRTNLPTIFTLLTAITKINKSMIAGKIAQFQILMHCSVKTVSLKKNEWLWKGLKTCLISKNSIASTYHHYNKNKGGSHIENGDDVGEVFFTCTYNK